MLVRPKKEEAAASIMTTNLADLNGCSWGTALYHCKNTRGRGFNIYARLPFGWRGRVPSGCSQSLASSECTLATLQLLRSRLPPRVESTATASCFHQDIWIRQVLSLQVVALSKPYRKQLYPTCIQLYSLLHAISSCRLPTF
jgi:hypothetical protein